MKIRNGFVSNSSSSSFVIAIAEVTDEEKIRIYLKENKIDAEIVSYEDFVHSSWYGCNITDNAKLNKEETEISIESFDYSTVSLPYDKTKKYLAYYSGQDCECNEDGETIFDESVCDEIDRIAKEAEGISKLQVSTGCGRNG